MTVDRVAVISPNRKLLNNQTLDVELRNAGWKSRLVSEFLIARTSEGLGFAGSIIKGF